jgi:AMMECR1 domain-containing protein
VKKYGVIVSCGARRGLLLPDLDGVDTVDDQVDIAMRKGGISPTENSIKIRLYFSTINEKKKDREPFHCGTAPSLFPLSEAVIVI